MSSYAAYDQLVSKEPSFNAARHKCEHMEDRVATETLGGNLVPGRPAALFAGGKTHVFAIGAGGTMNEWSSANGIDWQGPGILVRANTNLEPSYPSAVAIGNAVHVFAIVHGAPLSSGGPLAHWFSPARQYLSAAG